MIEYSKTAADNKARIRELTWMQGRVFMIAASCVLPLSAFFFLVGIVGNNSEAVQFGIYCTTLFIVLLAIYGILYSKYKKAVTANFDNHEVDGRINFALEKIDDDTLEFSRLTDEESFQVQKSDIKAIRNMKTIHVIMLKDGRTIDLPKRADIDEMLRSF